MRCGRLLHVLRDAILDWGAARSCIRVGRGRCVLRARRRPIGLDGYAPGSGPRGDQLERAVRTGIGEQPCSLADDDGIGEQVELVDQVVGELKDADALEGLLSPPIEPSGDEVMCYSFEFSLLKTRVFDAGLSSAQGTRGRSHSRLPAAPSERHGLPREPL
jgi:hypothetical protein